MYCLRAVFSKHLLKCNSILSSTYLKSNIVNRGFFLYYIFQKKNICKFKILTISKNASFTP